ncbi:hypothetical protein ACFWPX_08095 [Nocardia sp. NPDC058518]|uniref:hypothetical protein n=1 Tax=Nocardia sp. NPDC058518 TaxID=3346534 RepID=UPI003657E961
MRFVKTSAFAVAFAAVSVFGAGMAQAATVKVTGELLGCAFEAGVSNETIVELTRNLGGSTELSAAAAAELEGCL